MIFGKFSHANEVYCLLCYGSVANHAAGLSLYSITADDSVVYTHIHKYTLILSKN